MFLIQKVGVGNGHIIYVGHCVVISTKNVGQIGYASLRF